MLKLNPYLTFPGTAAQAIELYKEVFNVAPTSVQKFKDVPSAASAQSPGQAQQEGIKLSAAGGERIMHARFQLGSDMLMISDVPEGQDNTAIAGTQTHVSVHPDSKEEAYRMFLLLSSDGGGVVMPITMQFWGNHFGMCQDRFGIRWMINYHEKK
jgi:PhnB protein